MKIRPEILTKIGNDIKADKILSPLWGQTVIVEN